MVYSHHLNEPCFQQQLAAVFSNNNKKLIKLTVHWLTAYSCVFMLLKKIIISFGVLMGWCKAPTSGTFSRVLPSHALTKKKKEKEVQPSRQMINKHRGLETDDLDVAASCWKHDMMRAHLLASYQTENLVSQNIYTIAHECKIWSWRAASHNLKMPTQK